MKGLALIYLVLFLEMLKSFILKRNLIKFYNNKSLVLTKQEKKYNKAVYKRLGKNELV